jgi:LemA protein
MKVLAVFLAFVLAFVLICGGMFISDRNQMVALNEQVNSNWSEVDVNLERRADLIPNLVATVKGYAAHEQTVFDDVAKARAALAGAQNPRAKIAANAQLDGALSRLLAIVENYPQLKANEGFLRLQDELAGTENRIAVARKRYNDSLQAYNTYIGQFPHNVFARWAGFQRNNAYFRASEASRAVPKVSFPAAATQ